MSNTTKKTGTVKHFNDDKGYGFIKQDASKEDIFFHISEVSGGDIREGDEVSYDIEQGKKGDKAVKVSIL